MDNPRPCLQGVGDLGQLYKDLIVGLHQHFATSTWRYCPTLHRSGERKWRNNFQMDPSIWSFRNAWIYAT